MCSGTTIRKYSAAHRSLGQKDTDRAPATGRKDRPHHRAELSCMDKLQNQEPCFSRKHKSEVPIARKEHFSSIITQITALTLLPHTLSPEPVCVLFLLRVPFQREWRPGIGNTGTNSLFEYNPEFSMAFPHLTLLFITLL